MKTNEEWAIANCRVSTKEQEINGNSLIRQNEVVRKYAEKHGYYLDKIWSGSRSSKRGKNISRKDLQEMLDYCKQNKKVKHLIVDEPDRFMRSLKEGIYFSVRFEQLGVRVEYASDESLNGSDALSELQQCVKFFTLPWQQLSRLRLLRRPSRLLRNIRWHLLMPQ